jgi:subtilisin family serine protease
MGNRYVVASFLFVLVFSMCFAFAVSDKSENRRVIANDEVELQNALEAGCTIVRETRTITALTCPVSVADSLGLQEDIKFFITDSGANNQIGANQVQTSGNTGAGRKIVVIDTGYNYNHPELSSSYLGGKDLVNNDNDPMDDNGHGTHVAGLITADGIQSQAKGVAPGAGILSVKVLGADGSGYFSDTEAAIYYVVDGPDGVYNTTDDFKVDAISISLGSSSPYLYKGTCDTVMPSMTAAIKYARDHNVLVVIAAGNSGAAGVSIPGCISYATTIGAVSSTDKIASFSGRGNAVDLTSPGVSLYSTWLGSSYYSASGTSMATPVVSAVVALIKLAHPNYTDEQVESALINTAKDLGRRGKDKDFGYGRVDALRAVSY